MFLRAVETSSFLSWKDRELLFSLHVIIVNLWHFDSCGVILLQWQHITPCGLEYYYHCYPLHLHCCSCHLRLKFM